MSNIAREIKCIYCKVTFKGKQPYEVECSTNFAFKTLLGGKIFTQKEYDKYWYVRKSNYSEQKHGSLETGVTIFIIQRLLS